MSEFVFGKLGALLDKSERDKNQIMAGLNTQYANAAITIEQNYRTAERLREVGLMPDNESWSGLEVLKYDLGLRDDSVILKLNLIRHTLGHRLHLYGKDLVNEKYVKVTLSCNACPGLRVTYTEKIKRGGKCKVVTMKYKRLVCEV